jgi:hypothetical protein
MLIAESLAGLNGTMIFQPLFQPLFQPTKTDGQGPELQHLTDRKCL